MGMIIKTYELVIFVVSNLQSVLLLAVRLYWGWQFFVAGKGKLEDIEKFAGFLERLEFFTV